MAPSTSQGSPPALLRARTNLFARLSPTPRLASTSAFPAASTPSSASSPLPPHQRAEPSRQHRDLAVAMDGSFVETTSESAARALAKWYAEQGGGDYLVSSREDEGGKKLYRIRPRSLSPEPTLPTFASSDRLNSMTLPHPPLSRPSIPPGGNPTFTLQAASPLRAIVATSSSLKPLRTSKSIPSLAWTSHRSSHLANENTPERPSPLSTTHLSAHSRTRSLRRAGSTPSLSTRGAALSNFKTPPGSQGDVLGRLLGWSNSTPPATTGDTPSLLAFGDRSQVGTAQLGLPAALKGGESDGVAGAELSVASETDTTDLPVDLVNVLKSTTTSASDSLDLNTLGPNSTPRIPTPLFPVGPFLSKSFPYEMVQQASGDLREVASSDSIRTAKAHDHDQTTQKLSKPRFQNPHVFDVFQSLDHQFDKQPPSYNFPPRELSPTSSATSPSSSIPELSRGAAQDMTVSATAGDDPRFIVWGYRGSGNLDTLIPAAVHSARFSRRPSGVTEVEVGSPVTSNSDRGAGGGSSATTATTVSNRWSLSRKGFATTTDGSPASSVRDSVSSGSFSSPPRILLAATVERWIAELTSQIEGDLLSAFFLTYRQFVTPLNLLHLLITRFNWAVSPATSPEDEAGRRIVRVRTFVVIRYWLLNHFVEDFIPNRELRTTLTDWLNGSSKDDRLKASPKDYRLIKGLKKLVRRLKEMHVEAAPEDAAVELMAQIIPSATATSASTTTTAAGSSGFWPKKKSSTLESAAPKTTLDKVSDEDVDLVLEHLPPIKVSSPTRANRKNSNAGVPFLSKLNHHHHPLPLDEAPFSEFTTSRSSSTLFSAQNHFPLPNSQHPIARSFTSALGTFGRFKRMLGNITTTSSAQPQFANCGSIEAFDEELFEKSDTGDLLWVKGGLDRYLDFFEIPREPLENETGESEEAMTLMMRDEEAEVVDAVNADHRDVLGSTPVPPPTKDTAPIREPLPPQPAPLIPYGDDSFQLHRSPDQSGFDLLDHSSSNNFFLGRPHSGRIELDDVDLSDEDDDVVEVKKTLKRFPAAHNLRLASNLRRDPSPYRRSMESVSSYGAPIGARHISAAVSMISEPDVPLGAQTVPNFILEGIDSDDDEPGDVEAALRRLEGLVDDSKEREKARRVERQMAKSQQLKMSIPSTPGVDPSAADTDSIGRASLASSVGSNWVPVTPLEKSTEVLPAPASPEPAPRGGSLASPIASPIGGKSIFSKPLATGAGGTFPRKAGTPNRRPSLTNLFATSPRPLSTRPGPSPPTHRSFLLNYKTEILAQQFCLIERDMLRVVGWQELVEGSWKDPEQRFDVLDWEAYLKERRKADLEAKRKGYPTHSNVQAVIQRFNLTANWVCSEIILTANMDERAALIAKLIRVAFKCYRQCNFQTLAQIVYGLQSPEVERLKKSWARVSTWEMRQFRSMRDFVSHLRNFKLLREATAACIAEYGPPLPRASVSMAPDALRASLAAGMKSPTSSGCIPFLGIWLRDLAMNAELPTFLDPTSPKSAASLDSNGWLDNLADPSAFANLTPLPPGMELLPLVNVHKFRLMAAIIQRLVSCQEVAEGYAYTPEADVYFKCLKLRALDPALLRECSLRLEP